MTNARKKAFRNNRRKRKKQEPSGVALIALDRFAKFSSLSVYNLEQILGLQEYEKIKNELVEKKFIKLGEKKVKIKRNKINYYKLTTKGVTYLKNKDYTIYSSNSPRHDLIHATNVLDNFSSNQIDNYKHEKELYSYGNRDDISRVDGAIENTDGSIILIETITKYYKQEQIESKREYARLYRGGTCAYKEFNEKKRR